MAKTLKEKLLDKMKARGVKVPTLARQTDIPADRIYKWFQLATNPKEDDAVILEKWINLPDENFKKTKKTDNMHNDTDYREEYIRSLHDQIDILRERVKEINAHCGDLKSQIDFNSRSLYLNQMSILAYVLAAAKVVDKYASGSDLLKELKNMGTYADEILKGDSQRDTAHGADRN